MRIASLRKGMKDDGQFLFYKIQKECIQLKNVTNLENVVLNSSFIRLTN